MSERASADSDDCLRSGEWCVTARDAMPTLSMLKWRAPIQHSTCTALLADKPSLCASTKRVPTDSR